MSTTLKADNEEKPESASPEELGFIPQAVRGSANVTSGTMNGVQVGSVNGGMTMINQSTSSEPELFVRKATDEELNEARCQFVCPPEFVKAHEVLANHHVVVLCGVGSGRSFTGRRLLIDQSATDVIDLNRARKLDNVRSSDLTRGEGYIWDVSGSGDNPLENWEFDNALRVMKSSGCRLVIILDHHRQTPAAALGYTVELTAPDPIEVALAAIHSRRPDAAEKPMLVLESDLVSALNPGDPPEKAVRAAGLAIRIAEGTCELTEALAELDEEIDQAVAKWFGRSSTFEYSMLLAVALLEDQPFDEVAAHALLLDRMIREAELPEDKKPRPNRVFAKAKRKLLEDIQAITVVRDHPRHPGLREETIRFARQGWAAAVIRHVWREYHVIHDVLLDWMCTPEVLARFSDASARALCALVTEIPAHDPMRLVNLLAKRPQVAQRDLAASILARLAEGHNLLSVVTQTLQHWIAHGTVYQKSTAALAYGSEFGQRDPRNALAQLARIGRFDSRLLQNVVVRAVLVMLKRRDQRAHVLKTVLSWVTHRRRHDSLRTVGLAVGMWIIGLLSPRVFGPDEFMPEYDGEVRTLMEKILADPWSGSIALSHLEELATKTNWEQAADSSGTAGAELVRIATLITPDLRWWRRHEAVAALCKAHPTMRTRIRHIFRRARKVQREARRKA